MSGYTAPTNSVTFLGDDALADFLGDLVSGVTALDRNLVRPRWQSQPPTQPEAVVDWCAIGVTGYEGPDYPQVTQDDIATASIHRWEEIQVLASFYGPNSSSFASLLRDALYIPENRQIYFQSGIKLKGAGEIVHLGEEIQAQFITRSDLPITFTRFIDRSYTNITIGTASVSFTSDDGLSCVETITQ